MPAASTSVKYFHSAMSGAPTLSGVAGTLIAVLDACLKDGFNLKTVDSLVVAGGIATANISTGVGAFEADTVVLVAGATPAELNGEKRIISVGANTVTFDATGASDQTATGTITAKLAPAGWDKPFSGTNLAVYRSADVTSTRMYLRVDDTGATNARVVAYEQMTDVNTGAMPFPTSAQQSGGFYWPKASTAVATARAWTVIADSKTVWLYTNTHLTSASFGVSGWTGGFGDFISTKSGDAYSCLLLGTTADAASSTTAREDNLTYAFANSSFTATAGGAIARSYTGLGGSVLPQRRSESHWYASEHSGSGLINYPNGPDNSLILTRIVMFETSFHMRGAIRGALFTPHAMPNTAFSWRDKVDGQGSLNGRKLMAIKGNGGPASVSNTTNLMFFDITGPWG